MLLRELFDREKTAVVCFGRFNPPTIGHEHLINKMRSVPGDPFLFLSHTQNSKTDPLDFETKSKFVKQMFPDINVGHRSVKTVVQCLEYLQEMNYNNIVFIAGGDRVDNFKKMFNSYNGKADKNGNVPFDFNSIKVVSAGDRDPDATDVSGMSASKLRLAAVNGDMDTFAQGISDKKLAKTVFDAVRKGMGIEDLISK